MLLKHGVQNRGQPALERDIVLVRHNKVADSVHALGAEVRTTCRELAHVCRHHALDEVLLDAARRGDDRVDHLRRARKRKKGRKKRKEKDRVGDRSEIKRIGEDQRGGIGTEG